jgi:hypothetical protein
VLIAIDTSVLVAGIVTAHESHAPAKRRLDAIDCRKFGAIVCTHALAELYGVLSRIPRGLSPEGARLTVSNLPNRMRVARLTVGAYMAAIERCSARSLLLGCGGRPTARIPSDERSRSLGSVALNLSRRLSQAARPWHAEANFQRGIAAV